VHDDRVLSEGRLHRFVETVLPQWIYRDQRRLLVTRWAVPGEPVPLAQALTAQYEPVTLPTPWGKAWATEWFHGVGTVPEQWRADDPDTRVEIVVDLGFYGDRPGFQSEGLAYRADGTIIKGIAPRSQHVPWTRDEPNVDVYIEAAANPDLPLANFEPTRLGDRDTGDNSERYVLRTFAIALLDIPVWELAQDIRVLQELMKELPTDAPRRRTILASFQRMLDAVDPANVSATASAGRACLAEALASPAAPSAHRIVAVGHAHIDTAWLWPLRETIRKCARTFSSAVALMDEHPEYRFACSSAQQFAWMQAYYPALFERIREKVATGQFIPVGGMWVEPDMNMPGGEAMARQLIEGKKYFLREFGVDSEEAWVPDTFGYSAAIPQILASAGIRWFMTQKISWNQTNTIPHSTFLWEGIDGTRMFTHFPSADTYISELSGAELAHAERNFKEHGAATTSMVPFGWGDGGGGPTREMLAAATRLHSLEGSPRVEIDTPRAFFERAESEYIDPPVWSGELYLELHRGALTSQHPTKRGNRRAERLLHEAELWAATAAIRVGAPYPYDALETAWQTTLLHQFHDILPGTSIAWVHREAEEAYARVERDLEKIIAASLASASGPGDREMIANASPVRSDEVAAMSIAPTRAQSAEAVRVHAREDGTHVLENGHMSAEIDPSGRLVSLRDGSGRDGVHPAHPANELRLYRDTPNLWDAWDIDSHYRRVWETATEVSVGIISSSSDDEAAVRVCATVGRSSIVQEISLRRGDIALTIRNTVHWAEQDRLLKLEFPLAIAADRYAAEVQFGHVFRPTHTNTSWDSARFEACAHRWVHVGEPGFGVAIANESSYGHSVRRERDDDGTLLTVVGLSMLRSPRFPDPTADHGCHDLTYRIAPGADIREAMRLGYETNMPVRRVTGGRSTDALFSVSHPGVKIETVKLAEDRSGDVIVRLYESEGNRSELTVDARFDCAAPVRTDLLERTLPDADISSTAGSAALRLRPFELATLRFPRSSS